MKKYIIFIVLAGFVFTFSLVKAGDFSCTTDVKLCPDGSYVSRTGPKCRFEACPKPVKEGSLALLPSEWKEEMKAKREAFVSELKADRETFMTELKARREAWKTTKSEMKLKFCEKVNEVITKRFATVLTQLEGFQTKVGDKIEELNDAGKDTALATEALNLSKSKLADAKVKLVAIKALVGVDCTTLSPETFAEIKLGAREAKDLLKESRESLHQAVEEIKNLREEKEEENENPL